MIYHIVTHPDCNLCCEYCCGKSFDEPESDIKFTSTPTKPIYTAKELASFLAKDNDKPVSLIFYGGEPLMNIPFIQEIMDSEDIVKVVDNFLIQTNGTLFHKLDKKYVNKFHTILVSIDGDKVTTNKNRGEGTYEKVINNLQEIKANGFSGEIIARMTIEEPTEFFEDISFLINQNKKNNDFVFSSVHWQLDANMWHDYDKRNFVEWSKKYDADVSKLADLFVNEAKKGNLLRLYPFIGVLNTLLFGTQYSIRCGSGIGNFTVQTNGKLVSCPIMQGIEDKILGDIKTTLPKELVGKLSVGSPCTECSDLELCGGRCLYSNMYPCWPKKGINEICVTIKHLLREMERITPEIQKLIDEKVVSKEDLEFLKYNCAEIIP
ncbi:MAG: TIGR04084 family radical SAM/SPASM domain-containing protein [archaeon]|jgi:putative peptide-modifying radical SAM enzyme